MCSETGLGQPRLQLRNDASLVRQGHLVVEPGPKQSGGRITAAEHVRTGVGQRRGVGDRVVAAPVHQGLQRRAVVHDLGHHPLKSHEGTGQREGILVETGDQEGVVTDGFLDPPQRLQHQRPAALPRRVRRRDAVDAGGRLDGRLAGAGQGLLGPGKATSAPMASAVTQVSAESHTASGRNRS